MGKYNSKSIPCFSFTSNPICNPAQANICEFFYLLQRNSDLARDKINMEAGINYKSILRCRWTRISFINLLKLLLQNFMKALII